MEQQFEMSAGDIDFIKLTSENDIFLRKMTSSDIVVFHQYRSNSEVARYQSWEPSFSIDDAALFVNQQITAIPNIPGKWIQLSISLPDSTGFDVNIGDVAFCSNEYEPSIVEMGVTLSPSWQGKGVAFKVVTTLLNYLFHDLNKHRVTALIDTRNTASIKLFTSLGFRQEAHYVENTFFKGEYCSEFLFAMLKREWKPSFESKRVAINECEKCL